MNDSFPSDLPADEMSDYVRLYLDETNEQLDSLVEIFLELENQAPTPEELNEAFVGDIMTRKKTEKMT